MFCRNCGQEINEKAEICVKCGVRPFAERNFCQECGAETKPNQELCVKCGVRLKTAAVVGPAGVPVAINFSTLEPYYHEEFQQISDSNEQYKGKWNWAAFLFGPIWGLTKGLWLAPLIGVIAGLLTGGVAAVVYWFIFGLRGNYMYYCAFVKKKQLWA